MYYLSFSKLNLHCGIIKEDRAHKIKNASQIYYCSLKKWLNVCYSLKQLKFVFNCFLVQFEAKMWTLSKGYEYLFFLPLKKLTVVFLKFRCWFSIVEIKQCSLTDKGVCRFNKFVQTFILVNLTIKRITIQLLPVLKLCFQGKLLFYIKKFKSRSVFYK